MDDNNKNIRFIHADMGIGDSRSVKVIVDRYGYLKISKVGLILTVYKTGRKYKVPVSADGLVKEGAIRLENDEYFSERKYFTLDNKINEGVYKATKIGDSILFSYGGYMSFRVQLLSMITGVSIDENSYGDYVSNIKDKKTNVFFQYLDTSDCEGFF